MIDDFTVIRFFRLIERIQIYVQIFHFEHISLNKSTTLNGDQFRLPQNHPGTSQLLCHLADE